MYEAFFQLRRRPFAAAVQVDRYFPAASIELAKQTIARCVERAEGPAIVVGPAGTGKSMLCQLLARKLGDRFKTAVLAGGPFGRRRALLQAMLHELGQPFRGLDEGELRLALADYAINGCRDRQGVVLLVDEAHALTPRMLEELRLLGNVIASGEHRVRIVLAGNASLEETFANPKLESFSQRLAARVYLGPFDRAETANYARSQISHAGGDPETLFAADAFEFLYRSTDGIPRLVNQVCDHALILASIAGERVVRGKTIEESWADLQQLPARWSEERETIAGHATIEFGGLESDAETPHAIPFQRPAGWAEPSIEARLDESERLLDQLDDEFMPAGSIGPKTGPSSEIIVTSEPHPFGENFAEEEIVFDPYASLDTEMFAGRPLVSSADGQALGQSLAAAARIIDGARPAKARAEYSAGRSESPPTQVESFTSSFEIGSGEVIRPFLAGSGRAASAEAANRDATASKSSEPSKSPDLSRAAGGNSPLEGPAADDLEDIDLIVIEDDPAPPPTTFTGRPQVKRQEYRQLFAKLRRG